MKLSELFSIGRRFGGSMSTPGASVLDGPIVDATGAFFLLTGDGQSYLSYGTSSDLSKAIVTGDGLSYLQTADGSGYLSY